MSEQAPKRQKLETVGEPSACIHFSGEATPALELIGLARSYRQGGQRIDVLRGIDLVIKPGEIVGLLGPSGAGKSTLLQAAGQLEAGYEGEIRIGGRACRHLSDWERTLVRRRDIGFVYQFHHLLPDFTALENVMLARLIQGHSRAEAGREAEALLGRLGLGERLKHRPSELSGGEQQRVAIARALVGRPRLLLADEPTGNLDEATADIVFKELVDLARAHGSAALIATHNEHLAANMDRALRLHDGLLA
ncbi:MAG: ABC transporter ATP-binding protein [Sphingomonadales bacterium]